MTNMNDDGRLPGMGVGTYCMLLHLSPLAGFAFPLLAIALPFVLWMVNKDSSAEVDAHGRRVLNWVLSLIVYWVGLLFVFWILLAFYMGVFSPPEFFGAAANLEVEDMWPFALAMGVIAVTLICLFILFPIIGGIKAGKGERWSYPLTIRFLREE